MLVPAADTGRVDERYCEQGPHCDNDRAARRDELCARPGPLGGGPRGYLRGGVRNRRERGAVL